MYDDEDQDGEADDDDDEGMTFLSRMNIIQMMGLMRGMLRVMMNMMRRTSEQYDEGI